MSQKVGTTVFVSGCKPLYREWYNYCFTEDSWQLSLPYVKNITGRGTYIRRACRHLIAIFMAEFCPVRLDDFCNYYCVSLFDLSLPCIFCKFICDLQDLASFHLKRLSIVWRSGKPYICCRKCVKLSALYEAENYCVCVVKASVLEGLLHKSLQSVAIRCLCCYQLLDLCEKLDCCARNENFSLVRGTWRGPCRNCISK